MNGKNTHTALSVNRIYKERLVTFHWNSRGFSKPLFGELWSQDTGLKHDLNQIPCLPVLPVDRLFSVNSFLLRYINNQILICVVVLSGRLSSPALLQEHSARPNFNLMKHNWTDRILHCTTSALITGTDRICKCMLFLESPAHKVPIPQREKYYMENTLKVKVIIVQENAPMTDVVIHYILDC